MNGFTLHWKRLKKFKAKHYSVVEDKPYTRDQIKIQVDAAPLRDKCIILLMASAGLRRGALSYLRIRDLQKIDKYNLYKINVYKKEQEGYTTFCTPECAKYIYQYLDWRKRIGEQLKPNSPLFRIEFDTAMEYNRPKERQEYPNKRRFFDCSTCQLSSNVGSGSIYMGSLQASLSRYSLSFISLSPNYCESCNSPLLLEFKSSIFYFVKTANDLNMNLGFKRHLIYKN
jgi:hypothetical protein